MISIDMPLQEPMHPPMPGDDNQWVDPNDPNRGVEEHNIPPFEDHKDENRNEGPNDHKPEDAIHGEAIMPPSRHEEPPFPGDEHEPMPSSDFEEQHVDPNNNRGQEEIHEPKLEEFKANEAPQPQHSDGGMITGGVSGTGSFFRYFFR